MLADWQLVGPSGELSIGVLDRGQSRAAILSFIRDQLPAWRDRSDRPPQSSETRLTSQLCAHLNGVARKMPGWDCFQFRVEEVDEVEVGRKVDLIMSPAGERVLVEGRSYTDFDIIVPVECKRLPTPVDPDREECEYVATRARLRGGIQRFKHGMHGAAHRQAGMIAYVQENTLEHWFDRVQAWIEAMERDGVPGWTHEDKLRRQTSNNAAGTTTHTSTHSRDGLAPIDITHMWVKMP